MTEATCPNCKKTYTTALTRPECDERNIQEMFPQEPAWKREQLITGICSNECWDKFLGIPRKKTKLGEAEFQAEDEAQAQHEQMERDTFFFLDMICRARNRLAHSDYVEIWGEELGNHIWRQDGSDLLKLWTSGLTQEQKQSFVRYIMKKQIEWNRGDKHD